jgi:signal recognition particle subunit SRP54
VLGGSRKRRIALGSGTSPTEINQLLHQFREMQQMMKMFTGGGGMGKMAMRLPPGMGGAMPAMAGAAAPAHHNNHNKRKKKRRR